MLLFLSGDDYQPVHSLKGVVVNASSIVLTWEKPPDIKNPRDIKVLFLFMALILFYCNGMALICSSYNFT